MVTARRSGSNCPPGQLEGTILRWHAYPFIRWCSRGAGRGFRARRRRATQGLGKVVVLDDDPTGVQTVHGVPVFTSWGKAVLRRALRDPSRTVYILTNSRALPAAESERLHRRLARNLLLAAAAEAKGSDFLLVSRSDSTLRGHYPLETQVLNEVVSVPLDLLRSGAVEAVADLLCGLSGFAKAVVNAVDYADLEAFVRGLSIARMRGRRFLIRAAASFVRVAGGIEPRPLLTARDLRAGDAAGLIVVGSYTNKTTRQLQRLGEIPGLVWVEWRVGEAVSGARLLAEARRVAAEVDQALGAGNDICVYTWRDFQNPSGDHLAFAARVSRGLVRTLKEVKSTPGFVVAKGGITAADVGVKALRAKRAEVMGQGLAGVPVWRLGPESRFPGMPYVIFAGNVGGEDALLDMLNTLRHSAGYTGALRQSREGDGASPAAIRSPRH